MLVIALMATTLVIGQKKELKKAQKALESLNYTETLNLLNQAEVKFAEMDKDQVVQFYLMKTEALIGSGEAVSDNNLTNAVEALSQAKSRGLQGEAQERADRIIGTLRGVFVNKAIEAQNNQKYAQASDLLTQGYTLSPTDTSFLYYAAGNLVNGHKQQQRKPNCMRLCQQVAVLDSYNGCETKKVCIVWSSEL